MAGIDKTYLDSYNDYLEIIKWCKKIGTVVDDYGNKFNPLDFVWEIKEEEFKPGMILWNTPTWFDIYLIRYCNVDFIQERLREQYSEKFIKEVLNRTSKYDVYERNGLGKQLRVNVLKKPNFKGYFNTWWWFEIETEKGQDSWNYNEYTGEWVNEHEGKEWNTNVCTKYHGKLTMRKIMRILRKWDLPAGLKISIRGSYDGQEYLIETKK